MYNYFVAIGAILVLMLAWVTAQHVARLFAKRHPEFGPAREGGSCGSGCSCSGGSCQTGKGKRE